MNRALEAVPQVATSAAQAAVVAITPYPEEAAALNALLTAHRYAVREARSWEQARLILKREAVAVLLVESELDGAGWKEILRETMSLPNPPQVIVMSRCPDETLWVEVLTMGGYDLLAKPFEPDQVLWEVNFANRCWHDLARGCTT